MILLDLDGVFVDLHRRVWEIHGLDPAKMIPGEWEAWRAYPGMTDAKMWSHPEIASEEFWATLPKTPWADELMELVTRYFPVEQQCFLTKPLPKSGSPNGKQRWIEANYPDRQYLIGGGKRFCAGPTRVLLDDADHNVADFTNHGGQAILFPRRWNKLHHVTDPMGYVAERLERMAPL